MKTYNELLIAILAPPLIKEGESMFSSSRWDDVGEMIISNIHNGEKILTQHFSENDTLIIPTYIQGDIQILIKHNRYITVKVKVNKYNPIGFSFAFKFLDIPKKRLYCDYAGLPIQAPIIRKNRAMRANGVIIQRIESKN